LATKISTLSDRDLDGDGQIDKFEIAYSFYNGRMTTGTIAEQANLGFEKIVTTDMSSGNYKIDTFRQTKPFQGML
jgi:hypothetical protein